MTPDNKDPRADNINQLIDKFTDLIPAHYEGREIHVDEVIIALSRVLIGTMVSCPLDFDKNFEWFMNGFVADLQESCTRFGIDFKVRKLSMLQGGKKGP